MDQTPYELTPYGFRWGPFELTRLAHIPFRGFWLEVTTPKRTYEVHISEQGEKVTLTERRRRSR